MKFRRRIVSECSDWSKYEKNRFLRPFRGSKLVLSVYSSRKVLGKVRLPACVIEALNRSLRNSLPTYYIHAWSLGYIYSSDTLGIGTFSHSIQKKNIRLVRCILKLCTLYHVTYFSKVHWHNFLEHVWWYKCLGKQQYSTSEGCCCTRPLYIARCTTPARLRYNTYIYMYISIMCVRSGQDTHIYLRANHLHINTEYTAFELIRALYIMRLWDA